MILKRLPSVIAHSLVVLLLIPAAAELVPAEDGSSPCERAALGIINNCPPTNPTPPDGKSCADCASALNNCDALCGNGVQGDCGEFEEGYWYPPTIPDDEQTICPRPYWSYHWYQPKIGKPNRSSATVMEF